MWLQPSDHDLSQFLLSLVVEHFPVCIHHIFFFFVRAVKCKCDETFDIHYIKLQPQISRSWLAPHRVNPGQSLYVEPCMFDFGTQSHLNNISCALTLRFRILLIRPYAVPFVALKTAGNIGAGAPYATADAV